MELTELTFDLLTLHLIPGVTPRIVRALRDRAPLSETLRRPQDHSDLLPAEAVEAVRSGAARRQAEAEAASAARSGTRIVGIHEQEYPGLVRPAHDPPPVLFVRGSLLPEESGRAVALVGSRAATPAGRALGRRMARELGAAGATVVSGLARGIDSEAHAGALEAKARTIAVLGSGLDRIYPPEHEALAAAIARSGALVSEFPMATPPHKSHFPRRNRILATWGRGVVVVEAGARSGALVTARLALDEGREVLAVPGHPSQPNSAGTNALIRDGAVLVRDAEDIAEELGLPRTRREANAETLDSLLALLDPVAPTSMEALAAASALSPGPLLARLMALELDGLVRRLPGPLFLRSS